MAGVPSRWWTYRWKTRVTSGAGVVALAVEAPSCEVRHALSPPSCMPAAVGLRRLPLSARGHHGGGALVPTFWPVLSRRRGTAGTTRCQRRSRQDPPLVLRFAPLFADAARPCRHAVGDRWQVDQTDVKVGGRGVMCIGPWTSSARSARCWSWPHATRTRPGGSSAARLATPR